MFFLLVGVLFVTIVCLFLWQQNNEGANHAVDSKEGNDAPEQVSENLLDNEVDENVKTSKSSSETDSMAGLDDSVLPFLHGTLVVGIEEAKDLPDVDSSFFNIIGKDYTDAFAKVQLLPANVKIAQTKVVNNSLYPIWGEEFRILVCHNANSLRVSVMDKDSMSSNDEIGWTEVNCENLIENPEDEIDDWFDLKVGGGEDVQGSVHVKVKFHPKGSLEEDNSKFLPCYFPMRQNNRITMYQDADTPQLEIFEGVTEPDGSPYTATRCWRDVYDAIEAATKFIYITGWSVSTEINLLRGEEDPDCASNIGELLKKKADEGVRVLVMIWNDKSSNELMKLGQMGTHDEQTVDFFAGSPVQVANVPREREGEASGIENQFVGAIYTHHQKTVIMDTPDQKLMAFIGGLDLTDGRYDTPEFPLFDYMGAHAQDFYQNCTEGATIETGPREPWHDIHAKVEGPVVLDIMQNFVDRWMKQAEDKSGSIYDISDGDFDLESDPEPRDSDGGLWNVQLFRSITSASCIFDEDRLHTLTTKLGMYIDDSIMRAYIQQIRKADHFIYIENQYFLGSAYAWTRERGTNTRHTIPREIVSKIIEKIESEENFCCYITIPMFPEGIPSSDPIQEILYWQRLTMESMYTRIAKAIQDKGIEKHPTDYLKFFCLAKQESSDTVPDDLADPEPGTAAEKARQSLRHCIYVHSKFMVVDDDYLIVGSANINQRSLGGSRDSEIAIGTCQPDFMAEDHDGQPRGAIHSFRMALWSAHLGGWQQEYLNPSSQECLDKVVEVTTEFQEVYSADDPEASKVHMLPYPIEVGEDGSISSKDGWECFPDSDNASVAGVKKSFPAYPGNLTT